MTDDTELTLAFNSDRSLLYYTLTSTLPVCILIAILLLTSLAGTPLVILSLIGAAISFVGLIRLLTETTLDVAGYPYYKLPIWTVFYLIIYLICTFTFVFFALHISNPGRYLSGFGKDPKVALLDALYISMCAYIGRSPESSFALNTLGTRFLAVGEGVLSMFLNVVIITKFVSAF